MSISVVLVTGFLGSGKTTFINRILADRASRNRQSDGKMAIIVNELGSIGIDGALLPSGITTQVELPGGCICCQLDEDLEKTIVGLAAAHSSLEQIVIETTGIAEPLPITWTLGRPSLKTLLRVSAIVTVIDATQHEKHELVSPSVLAQVEYADLLVLTKTDLATSEETKSLSSKLRTQNQYAPIWTESEHSATQVLDLVFNDPSFERHPSLPEESESKVDAHRHHDLRSIALPISGTLNLEALVDELEALPADYIRIKGVARAVDGDSGEERARWIAFHRVGARVSSEPFKGKLDPGIVAIGKNINEQDILDVLRGAAL